MINRLVHKWLRVPYVLNVHDNQRPKHAKATVLFIHGLGNSSDAWQDVIAQMPDDVRLVTIDLLGFGQSPKPSWAVYDAKTQANSVLATLLKLRLPPPMIIVGHSLGALVAIEIATRYPLLVKRLILCSPPLYKKSDRFIISRDRSLRRMFAQAQRHPDHFIKLAALAQRYKFLNQSFNLDETNVDSYMSALGSMIINQTSFRDAKRLRVPATIIRGTLDPFVLPANIRSVTKSNPNVTAKTIIAGHEVMGHYIKPLVKIIDEAIG